MRSEQALTFGFAGEPAEGIAGWFADGIKRIMIARGHRFCDVRETPPRLVLNFIQPQQPRPYRRRAKATFVASVVPLQVPSHEALRTIYPLLVRSLSNVVIGLLSENGPHSDVEAHFVTIEQGHYAVRRDDGDEAFFARVYDRLEPLASSNLVIDNVFETDLPPELWDGDEVTRQIGAAGRTLDALGLLPAPFPIDEVLSERDLEHVRRLYGIGGLSYGNISARARHDRSAYWMSASGVDKGKLEVVGRDILLVKGFDPRRLAMLLSVPPHVRPRRVSVDAIEHYLIYTEHPEVGAIIHVHAWMDGVVSTEVNYPCGTRELATEVADLVRQAPDPGRAVVGLKNHGLTITGPSLPEILDRVEGKIITQVPMS